MITNLPHKPYQIFVTIDCELYAQHWGLSKPQERLARVLNEKLEKLINNRSTRQEVHTAMLNTFNSLRIPFNHEAHYVLIDILNDVYGKDEDES